MLDQWISPVPRETVAPLRRVALRITVASIDYIGDTIRRVCLQILDRMAARSSIWIPGAGDVDIRWLFHWCRSIRHRAICRAQMLWSKAGDLQALSLSSEPNAI